MRDFQNYDYSIVKNTLQLVYLQIFIKIDRYLVFRLLGCMQPISQCAKIVILLFSTGPANFILTGAIIDGFHSFFSSYVKNLEVSESYICFIVSVILRPLFKLSVRH